MVAKNTIIKPKTYQDIDQRVERVLRGLGNPEPPLSLEQVRDLLKLDKVFYTADDPTLLQETVSRLKVGGKQIIKRPTLLLDAIRKFDLRALYVPDLKRILLDSSQPKPKHRWHEAHEMGHSILPWHEGTMLGDHKYTLMPSCHEQMEAEANMAAARLLFLRDEFTNRALDFNPALASVQKLKPMFGNTLTTTFWRCIETWGEEVPVVGMLTYHPSTRFRPRDYDPNEPCRHLIRSKAFATQFVGITSQNLFSEVVKYSRAGRGPIGQDELILANDNGEEQVFHFETFWNGYDALTMGVYQRAR